MKSVSLLTCTLVALLSNCVELASGRRGFESRRSLGSGFLSAISLCFFLHVFKLHLSINMLIMHTMNIKKMAVLFSNLRYSLEALILRPKKLRYSQLKFNWRLQAYFPNRNPFFLFSPRTLSQWLSCSAITVQTCNHTNEAVFNCEPEVMQRPLWFSFKILDHWPKKSLTTWSINQMQIQNRSQILRSRFPALEVI